MPGPNADLSIIPNELFLIFISLPGHCAVQSALQQADALHIPGTSTTQYVSYPVGQLPSTSITQHRLPDLGDSAPQTR